MRVMTNHGIEFTKQGRIHEPALVANRYRSPTSQTDGPTDGWTDGRMGVGDDWYPLWEAQDDSLRGLTGIDERKKDGLRRDRPTDKRREKNSFRVAYLRLKIGELSKSSPFDSLKSFDFQMPQEIQWGASIASGLGGWLEAILLHQNC